MKNRSYRNLIIFLGIILVITSMITLWKLTTLSAMVSMSGMVSASLALISGLIIMIIAFRQDLFLNCREKETKNNETAILGSRADNKSISRSNITEIDESVFEKVTIRFDCSGDIKDWSAILLSILSREFEICQGLFFFFNPHTEEFKAISKYAYPLDRDPAEFRNGEGLSGQVALNKELIYLDEMPENYMKVVSGLGFANPKSIIIAPIVVRDKTIALIELSFFKRFHPETVNKFANMFAGFAKVIDEEGLEDFELTSLEKDNFINENNLVE